ncbi:ABC transporter permease [Vicingaceae bacterium]|nr:ABC transporter permease [Vicingaceae bacterium]
MIQFITKRITYGFFVLLGVISVVFFLFNVLPGDPARMMLGQRADKASIEAINKDLGLNQPLPVQFALYLNDLSPISLHNTSDVDSRTKWTAEKYGGFSLLTISGYQVVIKAPYLRRSYQSQKKVNEIISETLLETTVLAVSAILFATFLGVLLGILSAIYKDSWLDRISLLFATSGMALPSFFVGIIIAWVFGYLLADYTGLNMTGSLYEVDDLGRGEYLALSNLILPAMTLGVRPLSVIVQLSRNSMLEVMSQDFVRTAVAKGLSKHIVILKHALKNALNPVLTAVSGMFASLMAGAVFVEIVFAWKGIGWEVVNALEKYDLPVVMGAVLVIAVIFVVINMIVDILYGVLDPRVRVS